MDILEIRFLLASQAGFVLSVFSIFLACIALFVAVQKGNKSLRVLIAVVFLLLTATVTVNMFDIQNNYTDIPEVVGMNPENAKLRLSMAYINAQKIRITFQNGAESSDNAVVESQSLKGKQKIKKDDIYIELKCKPNENTVELSEYNTIIPKIQGTITSNGNTSSVPQNNTPSNELSIIIEDCDFFNDGFHYEMPADDVTYIVDFEKGISGHFSYSRELMEQEYENWSHGGEILNPNGEVCNIKASFFSTVDGVFAVELPPYMAKGNYICLLYQYINDKYYEARFPFRID